MKLVFCSYTIQCCKACTNQFTWSVPSYLPRLFAPLQSGCFYLLTLSCYPGPVPLQYSINSAVDSLSYTSRHIRVSPSISSVSTNYGCQYLLLKPFALHSIIWMMYLLSASQFVLARAYTTCDSSQVLRPIPRRSFENTPASHKSSVPPLPSPENTNSEALDAKLYGASQPCRTRSVLNLTSSTLFGIYSPTGYEVSREEPTTPWGTGAQTPVQKYSADGPPPQFGEHWHEALSRAPFDRRKQRLWGRSLSLLLQKTLLFATGVAYGTLISHLHDNQNLTPVKVDAFNQQSWTYVLFWGLAGAALGTLQLWVDAVWSISMTSTENFSSLVRRKGSTSSIDEDVNCERPSSGADWTTVVRSVGAFIGIAFAIVSNYSPIFTVLIMAL